MYKHSCKERCPPFSIPCSLLFVHIVDQQHEMASHMEGAEGWGEGEKGGGLSRRKMRRRGEGGKGQGYPNEGWGDYPWEKE